MSSATTPTTTIADSVAEFNVGFNGQIGPRLAEVFASEQANLTTAGVPDGAVEAGDTIPDASLLTISGETVSLHEVLGGAPAVIVFYRGSWCPYCNITLKHYQENLLPDLIERGVQLIAVSPQTPEASELAITNGGLDFTVLSDPSNVLSGGLGILTRPSDEALSAHTDLGFAVKDSNADDTPGIPYPTVLVVDGSGLVSFADVHVDYTTRTEVPAILAAVDAR